MAKTYEMWGQRDGIGMNKLVLHIADPGLILNIVSGYYNQE